MTLVAYRDGVMAADSAVWGAGGRVIAGRNTKIRRAKSPQMAGALIACAGASGVIQAFHVWLEAGGQGERQRIKDGDGFQALVVHADGGVTRYDEEWLPFELDAPYHVLGAAEAFMLGSLAAGASAKEAVRLAILHTEGGAGEMQVEQLNLERAATREFYAQTPWSPPDCRTILTHQVNPIYVSKGPFADINPDYTEAARMWPLKRQTYTP